MSKLFAFLAVFALLAVALARPNEGNDVWCSCGMAKNFKSPEDVQNFRTLFKVAKVLSGCLSCQACCGQAKEYKMKIEAFDENAIQKPSEKIWGCENANNCCYGCGQKKVGA